MLPNFRVLVKVGSFLNLYHTQAFQSPEDGMKEFLLKSGDLANTRKILTGKQSKLISERNTNRSNMS